jgi:hypothetical protein
MNLVKYAVGYVRCSTDRQEDSPDQQKKEIETYAQQHGFNIVEWFDDFGKSGTNFDERTAFQTLKQRVENHPNFEAVICYDESRWGRAIDAEENTYWRVHFRRYGVSVLLVKTSVDPKHEYAPMLQAFEGVQASQYSKKLSELTLRGAKNNSIFSNGGTAPYGYTRIAVNTRTGIEKQLSEGEWCNRDQEKVKWGLGETNEQEVVQFIFNERAKGKACVLIAKELNEKNVPCPKRGRWRNSDQKWSAITIRTIIENPAYYGARIYNRNSMSKIQAQHRGSQNKLGVRYPHWRNDSSEWVIIEDAHTPIVRKALWEQANSINKRQKGIGRNGYTYRSQYLLTGLIRCSKCGFGFQGWSGKAKGRMYSKYIDSGWQNKRVCEFLGIPKEQLEDFAIKAIKETLSEPASIKQIEDKIQKLIEEKPKRVVDDMENIKKALANNEIAIRNLTQAIERGVGIDSILDRMKEIEKERLELQEKLRALKTDADNQINVVDVSREVVDFITNFESIFQQAPIEERKMLVKLCISRIVVERERGVVQFFVRKIPAISPKIEELYENKKALTCVVSAESSGGRT